MSSAFVRFGYTLPLMTASAMELSVYNGFGGCAWPISSRMILMYTASLDMMYDAPSSALVADVMRFSTMWAMFSMAPLLCGTVELLKRKKWPPAWLHAFGLLR